MPTYNVLAAVVELIDADDEADARWTLTKRLLAAGFEPYEDAEHPSAFLSDVDTEGNPLPAGDPGDHFPNHPPLSALPIPTTDQNGYAR